LFTIYGILPAFKATQFGEFVMPSSKRKGYLGKTAVEVLDRYAGPDWNRSEPTLARVETGITAIVTEARELVPEAKRPGPYGGHDNPFIAVYD
jgi:hypothetical protein